MALVTITGIAHDATGAFPTEGKMKFRLSSSFIAADGHTVVPSTESAVVSAVNGQWQVVLESTKDAYPSDRKYNVWLEGKIDGVVESRMIGSIQFDPTPTSQAFADLILASLIAQDKSSAWVPRETMTTTDPARKIWKAKRAIKSGSELVFVGVDLQATTAYTIVTNTLTLTVAAPGGSDPVIYYLDDLVPDTSVTKFTREQFTMNGIATTITLAEDPIAASIMVFKGSDFTTAWTVLAKVITFTVAPANGTVVTVLYRKV